MGWYQTQLKNRNYLSPAGFKFILERSPKVSFLCKTASIPEINIGTIERPTPFVRIPYEGNVTYGALSLDFLVDEDLENYLEIHNWIRGMGVPENFEERREFETKYGIPRLEPNKFDIVTTDATLEVLNNNLNPAFDVIFKDIFPVSLTSIPFDVGVGDIEPFTASVQFRYSIYEIRTVNKGTRIK